MKLFRTFSDAPAAHLAAPAIVPGVACHPHYHTPDDTPDKLDDATLARVIDGLALTVAALAECG